MGNSEPKITKKYAVIITYTLAVVCLLLGLLLPVFYGKGVEGMLVMQLPKALDIVCGGKGAIKLGNDFVASHVVHLFGLNKAAVDITAWSIVLYAIITFFALLAFIPMGVTFKKDGKVTRILAYIIEIAAALTLSLYLIVALDYAQAGSFAPEPFNKHAINIWVAFGGTMLMLIIQCCVNKKKRAAAVKVSQFILSTAAICSLFAFYLITPKFNELWVNLASKLKCAPDLYATLFSLTGKLHIDAVFADNFLNMLKEGTAADKAVITLGAIVSVFTLLNFFIDIIGLASNGKRKGFIFNCVRYGLPFLAAVCLFISVATAKYTQGLALALLFVIISIELAINLGIILTAVVKHKKRAAIHDTETVGQSEYTPEYAQAAQTAQTVPDYSDNPAPYVSPYSQPFGSDQPSYLNPFGNAGFKTNPTE
ncbi:MAG: hypothetical protein K2N52_01465, partial [Clostridia bacterium]|nr:hypothetical protein [Clostridia bacterium]